MTPTVFRPRRGLLVLAALACAVATAGVYAFFVQVTLGQTIDEHALLGAETWPVGLDLGAWALLQVVPVGAGIIGLALVLLIAITRRSGGAAVAGVVAALAANGSTQLLKLVLERPDMGVSAAPMNSLPSGHATLAASVVMAVFFVSSPGWRPIVAGLGALATAAVGAATLLSLWHRPSDVIAALLVVAFWGCAAAFVLGATRQRPRHEIPRPSAAWLGAITIIAAVAALFALGVTVASALTQTSHLFVAYVGGVATMVTACFGLAWWSTVGLRWLP